MITTFYPPYTFGGDGLFVYRLSNELAGRGHTVDVVHCEDAYCLLAGREPGKPVENHSNVTVHGLRSPVGGMSAVATRLTGLPLFKRRKILRVLAKGFDVINFHNISLVGGPGVLSLGGDAVKLYTTHEFSLVCPTNTLFKFNREVCKHKQCLRCQWTYRRPPQLWRYTPLLRRAVQHLDAVITPDRHTPGIHREMGMDLPFTYIHHFVPDLDARTEASYARQGEPSLKAQRPYFLFVGRLEPLKGLHDVIPVFRRYAHADFIIAGTGRQEAELLKLADGAEHIRFVGHKTGRDLDSLYRHATAVVVPSINYEVAPPLVILEAFRHHTPAIVRNLGSMPEIIEDSKGGLLFASGEQLVDCMDELLRDPGRRHELGANANRAFRTLWTADRYMDRYFELIRECRRRREGAATS